MRLNRHFSKEDIQMAKRYANLLVSHVPVCIGCRWSRHWKGKVCTESKRTAIFSDLTIQSYWEQAQVSWPRSNPWSGSPWTTAVEVLSPNHWTSREFPPFGLLMCVPAYWRIFFESTATVDSSGEDLWTCTASGHVVHVG